MLSPVRCRYPKKALAEAGGGGSGNVAASLPRSSSGTTRGRDLRLLRTRHQPPGDPHRTPSPLVPFAAARSLLLDFPGPTRVFGDTEAEGSCDQNCLAESAAVTSRTGRMGGRAKGKLVVPELLRLLQLPGQSCPRSEGGCPYRGTGVPVTVCIGISPLFPGPADELAAAKREVTDPALGSAAAARSAPGAKPRAGAQDRDDPATSAHCTWWPRRSRCLSPGAAGFPPTHTFALSLTGHLPLPRA